jgi:hypothetical protein
MPMLDEDEYAEVAALYRAAMKATKEFREQRNIPQKEALSEERFEPVRKRYEQITGMKGCHENAILHHRLSRFGPPCHACGKPLRTASAKLCGSCMQPRDVS